MAALASGTGGHFWEIYNAQTGKPDGGWQVGHEWTSEQDQTWSATGYLRMVYAGLFGMRFSETGLLFEPTLPAGWGAVSLTGLHYRGNVLTVKLTGGGADGTEREAGREGAGKAGGARDANGGAYGRN